MPKSKPTRPKLTSATFNAMARKAQRIEASGKRVDDKTLMKLIQSKTPSGDTHSLVRGIHVIPNWVESTARMRTVFEAYPAIRALERAIEDISSPRAVLNDRSRRLQVRRLCTALAYVKLAASCWRNSTTRRLSDNLLQGCKTLVNGPNALSRGSDSRLRVQLVVESQRKHA